MSQKTAGVIAVLEGQPAPDFAVTGVSLKPDHILLKGTAALLADINQSEPHWSAPVRNVFSVTISK